MTRRTFWMVMDYNERIYGFYANKALAYDTINRLTNHRIRWERTSTINMAEEKESLDVSFESCDLMQEFGNSLYHAVSKDIFGDFEEELIEPIRGEILWV